MISYDVFWETLKQKNISQYSLIEKHGISSSVLTRIRRGDYLGLRKVEDLCMILSCDVQDIVTYIPDKKENE
jgi:DNA-binding Xre family transcriptional regulator